MEERPEGDKRPMIPRPKGITLPLFSQGSKGFRHILDYGWSSKGPVLTLELLREEGKGLIPSGEISYRILIRSQTLEITLSREAYCVGRWEGEEHIPCPHLSKVVSDSQCDICLFKDHPDPACVFEPHCWHDPCGAPFCQADHVVYLALYGDHLKVGMTQKRRLEARAREQGADALMSLMILGDRYSARTVERSISSVMGIPQSIHPTNQIGAMMTDPAEEEFRRDLISWKERVLDRWGEISSMISTFPGDIKLLESPEDHPASIHYPQYPIPRPLPSKPMRNRSNIIRGEVVGIKGRLLILRSSGLNAYNMAEAVGRIALIPGSI